MNNYIYLLILLIFLIIYIILYNHQVMKSIDTSKDGFLVTPKESILPDHCPDYMTNVNIEFYLVNNDNPGSPKKFNTLDNAHKYLESINCPKLKPIKLKEEKSMLILMKPI